MQGYYALYSPLSRHFPVVPALHNPNHVATVAGAAIELSQRYAKVRKRE
jgi:hypothetical protein